MAAVTIKKAPIYEAKFPDKEILGFVKISFISVEFDSVTFSSEKEAMAMRYILANKFGTVTNIEKIDGKKYVCRLITNDISLRKCNDDLIGVDSALPMFEIIEH